MANIILENQTKLLEKGEAVICPINEWSGVEQALFAAQASMGKSFPVEAQWFLNRIGARIGERVSINSNVKSIGSIDHEHIAEGGGDFSGSGAA